MALSERSIGRIVFLLLRLLSNAYAVHYANNIVAKTKRFQIHDQTHPPFMIKIEERY